jgi:glycosyltransferase involved in cell wall biosynthesis
MIISKIKKYIDKAGEYDGALQIQNRIMSQLHPQCQAAIIIPAYNEKEYIVNLLKNITSLNGYKDNIFEVIIVNNNSSDNTVQLANDYISSNQVKNIYIVHENKKGVTAARRRGFDESVYRV